MLRRLITLRRHHDAGYVVAIAGDIYDGSMHEHPLRVGELLHSDGADTPQHRQRRDYYYQLLAAVGWCRLLLRTPTLVLAGDDDPLISLPNALVMRKLVPDSTLRIGEDISNWSRTPTRSHASSRCFSMRRRTRSPAEGRLGRMRVSRSQRVK